MGKGPTEAGMTLGVTLSIHFLGMYTALHIAAICMTCGCCTYYEMHTKLVY